MKETMQQSKETVLSKITNNGGDAAAGFVVVGVWGEVIPIIFGVLGALWFCLRFVNFIRVNVYDKEPWSMR